MIIEDGRLRLRSVEREDLGSRYLGWLNDNEVTRWTDIRLTKQSKETLVNYWSIITSDLDSHWWAIVDISSGVHIGNIKLHVISSFHCTGEMSLLIGEREFWGKGFGSSAIRLVTQYGMEEVGLEKISARIYAENLGSIRAFEKAGYIVEGKQINEVRDRTGRRQDLIRLTRFKD